MCSAEVRYGGVRRRAVAHFCDSDIRGLLPRGTIWTRSSSQNRLDESPGGMWPPAIMVWACIIIINALLGGTQLHWSSSACHTLERQGDDPTLGLNCAKLINMGAALVCPWLVVGAIVEVCSHDDRIYSPLTAFHTVLSENMLFMSALWAH